MKKLVASVLTLACMVGFIGCSENNADGDVQIFKTENITRITFYTLADGDNGFDVPSEHLAEISEWLSSFTIDRKADGTVLAPGSDSISVEIEYADGAVVKKDLSTTKIDGATYYMRHDGAPECYFEIFD